MEADGGHEPALVSKSKLIPDLDKISKEIWDLKGEIKDCLRTLRDNLRNDMRKDLNEFKRDQPKVCFTSHRTPAPLWENEWSWVAMEKLSNWALEANAALVDSLGQQKSLQDKLTDLESRSRRNNIWVFGVPEGEEGESTLKCIHLNMNLTLRTALISKFRGSIDHWHRNLTMGLPRGL